MTDGLIPRLRRFGDGGMGDVSAACREAADEIERLRADVVRLEATLLWLGDHEPQLVDAALNIHKQDEGIKCAVCGEQFNSYDELLRHTTGSSCEITAERGE